MRRVRSIVAVVFAVASAAAMTLDVSAKDHAVQGIYTVPAGAYEQATITGVDRGITVIVPPGVTVKGPAAIGPVASGAAVTITGAFFNTLAFVRDVSVNASVVIDSVTFGGAIPAPAAAPPTVFRLHIPVVRGSVTVKNTSASVDMDTTSAPASAAGLAVASAVKTLWIGGVDGGTVGVTNCTIQARIRAQHLPASITALYVAGAYPTGAVTVWSSTIAANAIGAPPTTAAVTAHGAPRKSNTAALIRALRLHKAEGARGEIARDVIARAEAALIRSDDSTNPGNVDASPFASGQPQQHPLAPSCVVAAMSYTAGRNTNADTVPTLRVVNSAFTASTTSDGAAAAASPFALWVPLFEAPHDQGAVPAIAVSKTTLSIDRSDSSPGIACNGGVDRPSCGAALAVIPGTSPDVGAGYVDLDLTVNGFSSLTATASRAAVSGLLFGGARRARIELDTVTVGLTAMSKDALGAAAVRGELLDERSAAQSSVAFRSVAIAASAFPLPSLSTVGGIDMMNVSITGVQLFGAAKSPSIVFTGTSAVAGCTGEPKHRPGSVTAFSLPSAGEVSFVSSTVKVCSAGESVGIVLATGGNETAPQLPSSVEVSISRTVIDVTSDALLIGVSAGITLSAPITSGPIEFSEGSVTAKCPLCFSVGVLVAGDLSGDKMFATLRPDAITVSGNIAVGVTMGGALRGVQYAFAPKALSVATSPIELVGPIAMAVGLIITADATESQLTAVFSSADVVGYGVSASFFIAEAGDHTPTSALSSQQGSSLAVRFVGTSTLRVAHPVEHLGGLGTGVIVGAFPGSVVVESVPGALVATIDVSAPATCGDDPCGAVGVHLGAAGVIRNLHLTSTGQGGVYGASCSGDCTVSNVTIEATAFDGFAAGASTSSSSFDSTVSVVTLSKANVTARSPTSAHGAVVLNTGATVNVVDSHIRAIITPTSAAAVRAMGVYIPLTDLASARVLISGSTVNANAAGVKAAVVAVVASESRTRNCHFTVTNSAAVLVSGGPAIGMGVISGQAELTELEFVGAFDVTTPTAVPAPVQIDVDAPLFIHILFPKRVLYSTVWLNLAVGIDPKVTGSQLVVGVGNSTARCITSCIFTVVGASSSVVQAEVAAGTAGFTAQGWAPPQLEATVAYTTSVARLRTALSRRAVPGVILQPYTVAVWPITPRGTQERDQHSVQFSFAGRYAATAVQDIALRSNTSLRQRFGIFAVTADGAPIEPSPTPPPTQAPMPTQGPTPQPAPPSSPPAFSNLRKTLATAAVVVGLVLAVVGLVGFLLYRRRQRLRYMMVHQGGAGTEYNTAQGPVAVQGTVVNEDNGQAGYCRA